MILNLIKDKLIGKFLYVVPITFYGSDINSCEEEKYGVQYDLGFNIMNKSLLDSPFEKKQITSLFYKTDYRYQTILCCRLDDGGYVELPIMEYMVLEVHGDTLKVVELLE